MTLFQKYPNYVGNLGIKNVITASIKKSPKQQKIAQSGHTELIVIILYTLVTITIKVYVATFWY